MNLTLRRKVSDGASATRQHPDDDRERQDRRRRRARPGAGGVDRVRVPVRPVAAPPATSSASPIVLVHSSAFLPQSERASSSLPFPSLRLPFPSLPFPCTPPSPLVHPFPSHLPSPPLPPCAPLFMREEGPWGPPPPPAPAPPSARLSLSLVVLLLLEGPSSCWCCQGREGGAEVARMGLAGDGSADTAQHLRLIFPSPLAPPPAFAFAFDFAPHLSG